MPSVAVVDCGPEDEPLLARLVAGAETVVHHGAPGPDEVVERAAGADVLVTLYTYTRVGAEELAQLPGLRLVATRTAGYSHIDAEAAAARGVAVATVPSASTTSVAEFTFGVLLALGRRLLEARESAREGRWDFGAFRGFELAGKTLGVVGLGAIGTRVAELGAAFGMSVLGWTASGRRVAGVEPAELDDLLARADVVSVNVALVPETRDLIDGRRVALLKPGAILVNTARGGIVDEEALAARLVAGELGGACLDVLADEPPPGERLGRLARVPNLFVTPHIAWHTEEALARQFEETTENVLAFLAGRPRNLVPETAIL